MMAFVKFRSEFDTKKKPSVLKIQIQSRMVQIYVPAGAYCTAHQLGY